MSATEEDRTATCQICLDPIGSHGAVQSCPRCQAPYHQTCWTELGGCAVYGCPNMVEVKKAADESPAFWGKTEKVCPVCAETIGVGVLECPFCKTKFQDIRPMTRDDVIPKAADPVQAKYRKSAIWLLAFSAFGFTSPVALVVGGLWYWSNREQIRRAGSTVQALTLIALGICLAYLLAIGLSLLVFSLRSGAS